MKALRLHAFGDLSDLKLEEVPEAAAFWKLYLSGFDRAGTGHLSRLSNGGTVVSHLRFQVSVLLTVKDLSQAHCAVLPESTQAAEYQQWSLP